jgi:hypothetical protein
MLCVFRAPLSLRETTDVSADFAQLLREAKPNMRMRSNSRTAHSLSY